MENGYVFFNKLDVKVRELLDLLVRILWNAAWCFAVIGMIVSIVDNLEAYKRINLLNKVSMAAFNIPQVRAVWCLPVLFLGCQVLGLKKNELKEEGKNFRFLIGTAINTVLAYLGILYLTWDDYLGIYKFYALCGRIGMKEVVEAFFICTILLGGIMIKISETATKYIALNDAEREERYQLIFKRIMENSTKFKRESTDRAEETEKDNIRPKETAITKKDKNVYPGRVMAAFMALIMIAALGGIFHFAGNGRNKEAYLNNSSDKLPVRVEGMALRQDDLWGYATISYKARNYTDKDLKSVSYGMTAWDENLLPIVLEEYTYDEDDEGYLKRFKSSNIDAQGVEEKGTNEYVTGIAYIQLVPLAYETYDGKKWENPAEKLYKKEYAGKKLNLETMNYFCFISQEEETAEAITEEPIKNRKYQNITVKELARTPEIFTDQGVRICGSFMELADKVYITAPSGNIEVRYNQAAVDEAGDFVGNVLTGDEGYVEGIFNTYVNEIGITQLCITADKIVVTNQNGTGIPEENEQQGVRFENLSGNYYMETVDAGITLQISTYPDVVYEDLPDGSSVAEIEVGIRIREDGAFYSNGSLVKNGLNEYCIYGSDLDGAILKGKWDCVEISGTGNVDGIYEKWE